ncbi:putative ADP-ribose pyrophosphatase YjhB [Bacillus sp. J14TS2]|uniref:NUDIX hydrolase n=1 Tax=Bacillus sp. J14TS2 TaxID=2807188 RepID=UPI001B2D1C3E|nr:NUDIX hydrolase [Bacillus sp. J14TS2]GIN74688.1 putative ADP-ribose pyrophosphatase YjhB [Bacillus sp. J14TS2]
MEYKWLEWAKKIQAISQAGLTFSKDVYDLERFEELRKISVEIMADYSGTEMEKVYELFANETGYQTPKLDVRGAVFQNNQILLVQENYDGAWSLPGGFCDIGLSPSENIIKEITEEAGYDVNVKKLLAVCDTHKHAHPPQPYHYYKLFFQCEIVGGSATSGVETDDVQFFSKNHLPALSQNRNTEAQIHMLFDYLENPNKETYFD